MAGESGLTFQKCFQLGFCLSRFKIIVWKIKSWCIRQKKSYFSHCGFGEIIRHYLISVKSSCAN